MYLRLEYRLVGLGPGTNRVHFSREWKSQIGYEEGEIDDNFEEWQDRVHPDDLAATLDKVRTSIDNPHGRHFVEFRFRHKNGTYRWISAQATVVRDAEGKPIRMLGCHIDLTGRKQAEEELRESERLLNEAQRLARIGSWQLVVDRPLILSDQMYELFKLPRGGPITKDTALSVIHPEDRGASYSHIFENALQAGLSDFQGEFRVVWPDGQVRTLSTSGEIRRDAAGHMIDAVGTVQDVTERKQAEQALRASEERFRLQVTASSDVVYRMSPDWSEMRLLTGRDFITDTLMPSCTWLQKYIHPDDQPPVLAAIRSGNPEQKHLRVGAPGDTRRRQPRVDIFTRHPNARRGGRDRRMAGRRKRYYRAQAGGRGVARERSRLPLPVRQHAQLLVQRPFDLRRRAGSRLRVPGREQSVRDSPRHAEHSG